MAEVLRIRVRADTVWQDSAGTIPAVVGDPVGRVDDASGGGFHVTQDVTGSKPTLLEDALGHLYLDFDGADDVLGHASFQPTSGGAQPFTVTAVVQQRTAVDNNTFVADGGSGQFQIESGTKPRLVWGTQLRPTTNPGTTRHVYIGVVNGPSSVLREDATEYTGDAGSSTWTAGLQIGRQGTNNATAFDGSIYEIVVDDAALDATARTALYDELWDYYSNPAGGGGGEVSGAITNAGQQIASTAQVEITATGSLSNAGQSASASASVEAAASSALTNAGQVASASADVDVSASGSLTNAGQSVQGFIGEVPAQVSGSVTNGGQSLSGTLTTEVALSAVVANGGQQISGSAAVDVAASASIENAGQVVAAVAAVAASLSGAIANGPQTVTGRMVNGAVLVPSRITLSLESTHALSLSVESTHVLELSIE